MAKMYSKNYGKATSTKPYCNLPPTFEQANYTKEQLIEIIVDLGRKGKHSAEIGTILRDQYAIGDIKSITNMRLLQILRDNNVESPIPEDVISIQKKCTNLHSHIRKFWNDKTARHQLKNQESKLHRKIRYYKENGRISKSYKPASFKLNKKAKL